MKELAICLASWTLWREDHAAHLGSRVEMDLVVGVAGEPALRVLEWESQQGGKFKYLSVPYSGL